MLTYSEVARILGHYDMGELLSVTQAVRGYVNQTAFIQTEQGRYVLRRNHRRLNEEAQRYRHKLVNYLVERDFPVPAFIPARTGDTLLVLDGRYCEVMEFVAGSDFDPDHPHHLESVGESLAHYHNLTTYFPAPPDEAPPRYVPDNSLRLIEKLLERDVMGDLHDILSWYDRRAAHMRRILSDAVYEALPRVVIHGDIHRDNFIFADGELVACSITISRS
ncbi:MAG: phosphotransferase, partial [Chloroflexaceae bacterium]|nr:phosphotransferase [Chloroflexaceae bacterium]